MQGLAIKQKKYTYQDYLKTPDDMRYELIEGDLIMTPAPYIRHQRISSNLFFKMRDFTSTNNLGEVFYAPCDVYLDDENVVQPDILFVSKERLEIITEKNIQGAPDLVVEIVSEGNAYRDTIQKKRLYARFGVKEYWIVAPGEKMIEQYHLNKQGYQLIRTYYHEDHLISQELQDFTIELREVF
ncbi:MAG: Uma2 family endonuclease [Candidatus Schekmanbacteria bacterium]|nr:Uma2 family endonuclease [Candidatus Schekmanbacteria bacterium]